MVCCIVRRVTMVVGPCYFLSRGEKSQKALTSVSFITRFELYCAPCILGLCNLYLRACICSRKPPILWMSIGTQGDPMPVISLHMTYVYACRRWPCLMFLAPDMWPSVAVRSVQLQLVCGSLPTAVQSSESLDIFRRRLKTELFERSY